MVRARWVATVGEVSRVCKAEHLNYDRDPSFVDEDFANSDHLSPAGAAKLTRLVDERLLRDPTRRTD
jgi:hypothetical protein